MTRVSGHQSLKRLTDIIVPFEIHRMQYLSFEVILSSQCGNFRQVVGAVSNDQLVKTFLNLLVSWKFIADGPFLLLLVTSNSGDFGIQSKMTIKLEMLHIAPEVFLYLGGRRVRGNI
jgi:hypothetical protein